MFSADTSRSPWLTVISLAAEAGTNVFQMEMMLCSRGLFGPHAMVVSDLVIFVEQAVVSGKPWIRDVN